MAVAIFPIVLAVTGALIYALASNPKVVEVGRAAMWAGFFSLAFALASHTLKIG